MDVLTKLRYWFFSVPDTRYAHLDALDGLRGVAVLLVLLSHLSNVGHPLVPGLDLSGTGKSGVYLFFVLSAFLLTRVLLDRPLSAFGQPRLWANYALRRVLRIWPLYLLILLLSAVLTHWAPGVVWHFTLDADAVWRHVQLREGQSVLWSIPVEFSYYALLPLVALALAVSRHLRWPAIVDVVGFTLLIGVTRWLWPATDAVANDIRLGPYLSLFLCGAFAASIHVRYAAVLQARPRMLLCVAVLALALLVLTVPSIWALIHGGPLQASLNHHWFLFFGLTWSALLLAVLTGPELLRRLFAQPVLRLFGVVSFSAYLWHMPLLDWLLRRGWMHSVWSPGAFVAATLLVAIGSYLVFERPWRNVTIRPADRVERTTST